MAKIPKNTFVTPRGIGAYCYLTKADTQFNPEGVYKTQLKLDAADAKPLIEAIDTAATNEFGKDTKNINLPYKTDAETGQMVFTMKSKYQPKFADASGKVVPPSHAPNIFGGSELRVSGNIHAYNVAGRKGVSLQMNGVQIIELSSGSSGGTSFDAVVGGSFVADNDNMPAAEDEAAGYNF
jgi:hypothetical protein